jgi:hypothetical protein
VGDEHKTGVEEFPAVERAQDVALAAGEPGGTQGLVVALSAIRASACTTTTGSTASAPRRCPSALFLAGQDARRHHIARAAFETDQNDRRAVMYEALAADDWYGTGGYALAATA